MGNNKFKILIVEDEANIRSFIKANLETSDYQVLCAETCELGMMMYASHHPDLIILDLGLPDRDGMSLIQEVRKTGTVPIIVLSARSSERDKVEALDLGANDYITKPFTLALVKMHIEAVLKRAGKLRTMVEYNDLQADVNAQLLFYKEQHIPTTRKEFDLIVYFMEHPGIVLPRDTILNAVWEYDYTGDVRTIDTLVKQLRKKMGEGCNYIRTVYGVGYIFGEDIHEN